MKQGRSNPKDFFQEESASPRGLIGGQRAEQGCLPAAGYSWCPSKNKCLRVWEEYCEELKEQYQGEK